MKHLLAVTAAIALAMSSPALAQQTVGPVGPGADAANSNSQSGATSVGVNTNLNGGNTVGPIDNSHGPVTSVSGPSSADSASNSQAGAVSGSQSFSEGGAGGSATSTSAATGGNSTATTGASTSSSVANPNANNAGNAQSITFNSEAQKSLKTNPTVYAPAMTTTLTETCMGSTSGGISVLGFGGTLGTTWNDEQCVRRLNAREMAQTLGDRDAARALLCQDKHVAAAYEAVGRSCFVKDGPPMVAYQVQPGAPAPTPPPAPEARTAPPATMAPIPNPPPSDDGERG